MLLGVPRNTCLIQQAVSSSWLLPSLTSLAFSREVLFRKLPRDHRLGYYPKLACDQIAKQKVGSSFRGCLGQLVGIHARRGEDTLGCPLEGTSHSGLGLYLWAMGCCISHTEVKKVTVTCVVTDAFALVAARFCHQFTSGPPLQLHLPERCAASHTMSAWASAGMPDRAAASLLLLGRLAGGHNCANDPAGAMCCCVQGIHMLQPHLLSTKPIGFCCPGYRKLKRQLCPLGSLQGCDPLPCHERLCH